MSIFRALRKVLADVTTASVPTEKGNKPVAFVLRDEDTQLNENEIIDYCKQELAGFKVPIRVLEIENFPTTPSPNGTKIQKATLRKLAIESLK